MKIVFSNKFYTLWANFIDSSKQTLAILAVYQDKFNLSWLKLTMIYLKPSPSFPIRFSTGTLTSSKTIKVVPEDHIPVSKKNKLFFNMYINKK